MYAWHITFDDQPQVHRLATAYQDRLAGVPGLDLIPMRWLHLTIQGLGFTDEVPAAEADAVVHAARERLAGVLPVTVTVGPAIVDPEAVQLTITPIGALTPVRGALRAAIADTIGLDRLLEDEWWSPHVSVAYSNATGPMEPIATALTPQLEPVTITISKVRLIVLGRDEHLYQWQTRATVP